MARPDVLGDLTADCQRIILMPDNGNVMTLRNTALALMTPTIRLSDPPGGLVLPVSWSAVVQLAMTYGSRFKPSPRLAEWIRDETTRRTDTTKRAYYWLPDGLEPRPYQHDGAEMINAVGSCLITDDPGTGKTWTMILGLLARSQHTNTWPAVVVAPSSVVDPWVDTWRQLAPHLRTVAWRGTPKQRHSLAGAADVYVMTYGVATRDTEQLLRLKAKAIVADEVHMIANPSTARSKAVRQLARPAGVFVGLSGTPITHGPQDLWSALNAMDPHGQPSRERYINRYCLTVPGDYKDEVVGLNELREPEFRTTLLGQHRRVAKADVLDQLPPKVYSVRTVELPREYRKAYDSMQKDMLAQLPDGSELPVMSVLAQLQRLSQLACAAADVSVTYEINELGAEVPHYSVKLKAPSWKVDALLEILDERPGQQTVVFAPSKQLILLAGAAAEKAGHRVGYIVGGQSAKERTSNVDRFQAGALDVICVTTQAGGVGITLTAASTAVFLQRPWSIVDSSQAEDRLHRIGSERHESIEIVDVVAENTIDSRVREALVDKAQQLSDLVRDPRIVAELLGGSKATPTAERKAVA